MNEVITYTNNDGGMSVVTPAPGYADSLEALAARVVPVGVDYQIIPRESLLPPPEPTPEELRAQMPPITARQFRLALVRAGFSLAAVEQALDAIEDEQAREEARIEWEYASHYERQHPLVILLAPSLGLTEEQVDTLWEQAASV